MKLKFMAKVWLKFTSKQKILTFFLFGILKKQKLLFTKKLRTGKCQFDRCVGAEEVKMLNMKADKRQWEKKVIDVNTNFGHN